MIYQAKYLQSIKDILPEDCIHTQGSRPVKVLASDINDYVCKYYTGTGSANSLFNEYLAAQFLKIWGLKVPDFQFVRIIQEHLKQLSFPFHYFDYPCFGSLYNGDLKELDRFFVDLTIPKELLDSLLKEFLKIGLFDIWLSNEDRHFENMNLMYDIDNKIFVPIDHVQIFNSDTLDREAAQLTDSDSILTSGFMTGLFSRTLQQNFRNIRLTIENEFARDIKLCHDHLEDILSQVPLEWNIDAHFIISRLELFFSDAWHDKCMTSFNTFVQLAINHKR